MYKIGRYRAQDSMAQLVCDNHDMLLVINHFGIALGFAEKSIEEACRDNGVDCTTFLAMVNLIIRREENSYIPLLDGVVIDELIRYLKHSHHYYISTRLPRIGEKLRLALNDDKISSLIIRYFEDYLLQVKDHLMYEEQYLFPYVMKLIKDEDTNGYSVAEFCQKHDHIDKPLTEFKNVIIKYYGADNSEEVVNIIHNLLTCASDISLHNMVEDRLLVPLILKIEADARG